MDNLKPLNILLLEDNNEFAKNIIELLTMYFHKIFHATSIKKSLKLYKNNHIDVIISDINVEDGNGLDFIKDIRDVNVSIPIVVLTAYKDENFLFKAIPLNITSYELKPLRYENFTLLLNKLSLKFKSIDKVFIRKNIMYSFKEKILYMNSININLTKKEILFIELMLKHKDKLVTVDMIQEHVWEQKQITEAGLKNLLFRLRQKTDKSFIKTVQGVGYKLVASES